MILVHLRVRVRKCMNDVICLIKPRDKTAARLFQVITYWYSPIPYFVPCQLKSGRAINVVFHWIAKWKLDFTNFVFHSESPCYLTFSVALVSLRILAACNVRLAMTSMSSKFHMLYLLSSALLPNG